MNYKHSETYKDMVGEYWKLRGYDKIGDSKDDNTTVDLVFRKTHDHGNTDVWVEAKDRDLSRTENDFLTEIARYFIEYQKRPEEEPFDLHIFIRNLKAQRRWKKIFKMTIQTEEAVKEFYDRIREDGDLQDEEWTNFAKYSFEDFMKFVSNATVHEASYNKLRMEIDHLKESDSYEFDTFTTEREPINERGELEPNIVEIADLPENIYIGNLDVPKWDTSIERQLSNIEPFWFESNKVFTFRPPDKFPDLIQEVTEMDTVTAEPFDSWAQQEENTTAAKTLLLREICRTTVEEHENEGCAYVKYRGDYYLLFEHPDLDQEEKKVLNRQVARVFDENDTFVKHRSAQLNVHRFDDSYFLSMLVKNHFTDNGRRMSLIRGDRKGRLHDFFNQNRYTNSQAYSEYRHWRDLLQIDTIERDTSGQEIGFRKITETVLPKRPPHDREEIEDRDVDTVQQQLGDTS